MQVFKHKELWFLILSLILLRMPTLDRPLSKHHEFNTAVILINAESWQQAGGGKQFSYTPFLNYQGSSNRMLEKGLHIDSAGRHVYLSFGAGWYVLPYFVLKAAHLPFTPIWVQLLNILINIITVVLLYQLLLTVTGKRNTAVAGTVLFAFLPAPLWYCGNGYVTTAIMLPLVLVILQLWDRFEKSSDNIKPGYLLLLFLSGIALSYFDWLTPFLLGLMMAWSFMKARSNKKYLLIGVIAELSILLGIFLVLAQFANYLGWSQVLQYWKSRFADRSTDTSEGSFAVMSVMILRNLVSGYLPLLLLLPFLWFKRKSIRTQTHVHWPLWALLSIVPYNGIFFNWSANHEFAWMAFGLIASLCISIYLFPLLEEQVLRKIMIGCLLVSVVQYFVINRPGEVSWKGEHYAAQKELAEWIKNNISSSQTIFTNLENDKIVEYYSKRTFNGRQTIEDAVKTMKEYHLANAIWLQVKNGKIEEIKSIVIP